MAFSQNHFFAFCLQNANKSFSIRLSTLFLVEGGVLDFFKNDGQKLVEIAYNKLLCMTKRQSKGCQI